MGRIDLDPASCEAANAVVRAPKIFTARDNGFTREWNGRVLLNPPGGHCDNAGQTVIIEKRDGGVVTSEACTVTGECGLPPGHKHIGYQSSQKAWWFKLAQEWLAGNVTMAVFVSFSVELLQTSQVKSAGPLPHGFPICFPRERVPYEKIVNGVRVPGTSPPHSSMFVFLPMRHSVYVAHDRAAFVEAFARHGAIVNA